MSDLPNVGMVTGRAEVGHSSLSNKVECPLYSAPVGLPDVVDVPKAATLFRPLLDDAGPFVLFVFLLGHDGSIEPFARYMTPSSFVELVCKFIPEICISGKLIPTHVHLNVRVAKCVPFFCGKGFFTRGSQAMVIIAKAEPLLLFSLGNDVMPHVISGIVPTR